MERDQYNPVMQNEIVYTDGSDAHKAAGVQTASELDPEGFGGKSSHDGLVGSR